MKNLKLYKLKTGEEILAEEVDVASGMYFWKNPVIIIVVPQQNPQQRQSLAFVPYVQFTKDETINVPMDIVVTICEPLKELVENYNKTFSPLTFPENGLILPR